MNLPLDRAALLAEAARLRTRILAKGGTVPPAPTAHRTSQAAASSALPRLSVMFFSAESGARDPYDLVIEAARQADAAGFEAVWLPERHFDRFGGPYPNPAVIAAAVSQVTARIRIRAGSVILPLHDPLELAEAWAMVDLLSHGRVDLAVGSGWNPQDFVLSPDTFANAKSVMRTRLDELRHLWAGGAVQRRSGKGETVEVTPHPAPSRPDLNVWIATTGNADSFAWAGRSGFNVLTMMLGSGMTDLADRIRVYREARSEAGLEPDAGRVTLMLHSYCDPDPARTLARVKGPLTEYVRGALNLHVDAQADAVEVGGAQRDRVADFAFQRYLRSASLIGTPDECREMMGRVGAIGVNEIACLLDFGLPKRDVLESLARLAPLAGGITTPSVVPNAATPPRPDPDMRKAAVIGMACRFPGAPDLDHFRALLRSGGSALRPPPAGRFAGTPSLGAGGFIDGVDEFDAEPFRLAPTEAALMDPHQRLFLETVWCALEDAGIDPQTLRGHPVGVFAAMYSTSHLERRGVGGDDPLAVPGGLASMVANRTSFTFDWRGPSETVNTACSSGLVAIERALESLRQGQCEIAVVGGVSLLLSDAESASLARLGILAPDGACRAFDASASGQVRGEGCGVVVLKRLDRARADGDAAHAAIAGAAVRHAGASAGSLMLPSTVSQAETVVAAWRDAGTAPAGACYVEAHGAGTAHGDLAEIAAIKNAFRTLRVDAAALDCRVGAVKPAIGSLDAAGGIAGLMAAILAVGDGFRPGVPGLRETNPALALADSGIRLEALPDAWPPGETRRAGVHAYGLGGVSAHVVVEQAAGPSHRPLRTQRAFTPRRYPLDTQTAVDRPSVVASFYDYVATAGSDPTRERRDAPPYLTLAPFAEVVPGFSWTRTMQDPQANPDHWRLMVAAQREMRAEIFGGVDFSKVGRVLDFGCGFGTDLIDLATRHEGIDAVGYTISPEQAAEARRHVAAAGLADRVQIHCRDSAAEAFPGMFQLAFGFEVGHHISDKDGLFGNLAAHLDVGATLALIDCASDTAAPIILPDVGSWTSTLMGYASILARHGFRVVTCIDASREVSNFLVDPGLDDMLAGERDRGEPAAAGLVERIQRSWDGFGQALGEGLVRYLLITAEYRPGLPGLESWNQERMRP
ncbi:MupA/Atu3671 family FMN-dependent luciferase-like monooxygenase [Azospirillum sp. B4]|uniref:MupA/Atu3671 family FMN-dependent luciferase-like monooxygenase n=1 Tax=Azospirillum sp. B4 TaxID=95605 RepID=UPI000346B30D|nr:MupA/Atu3671 family FMN-dependent luciferase-like monooxygenase [Azospirillum sp. B4]